ncbi:nucleoside-diphosphate sugar epimerase/dehydratase [Metasolibacillus meyeri]|uniref:Nucleoside-diphosphate sugar epimerase/dehydratase n=1 Tax=Metasolibacillus meyeri TaxID=1071052 RepID=A0AAW9NMQ8_9BACL|nr:nucleoside-diphosphate sugar epimerase/dehydratase [Metasolibacillus meyeri]MEC1177741.1 nucleoside-diphosphate sugar epimerase/dehydratase [Metasolibacillus meyeri]
MSYRIRYILFFIIDSFIVLSAIFMSYWLLHPTITGYSDKVILISAITLLVSHHIAAYIFHLYNRMWSVASVRELLTISYAVTISIAVASLMQFIVKNDVYIRVMAITWMLHIIMIGGSRFILRVFNDREYLENSSNLKRVLIVGAGQGGTMLAKNLIHAAHPDSVPIVFVDDDIGKLQLKVMNITIEGTTKDIPRLVSKYGINEIIIAIPSLGRVGINSIYKNCIKTNIPVKVMPSIEDVMTGKVAVNEMREVRTEELLGRDEVKLDMVAISRKLTDKVILVTGAGGSIGSEICRQVMNFRPKKIILLGHGENSIYTIHMELQQKSSGTELVPIIADIQDRKRIFEIIERYRPHVIYHAAAHKHVPLMEYNPYEAVKNNILGTKNVAEAANIFNVGNFVMISTDKAVNPPNVMGATKRIAEMIIQNLSTQSNTKYAAVRFGNVLGSRGSVIPLFKKQIAEGGPVTVTHKDMTRYFMTIPEASRLVLQAGTLGENGEIFVLDMGQPVNILDLAQNLIQLSGFTEEEIKIEFTGLRPGEKMYEELLNPEEIQRENIYPKIHIGKANYCSLDDINRLLQNLDNKVETDIKNAVIDLANKKHCMLN